MGEFKLIAKRIVQNEEERQQKLVELSEKLKEYFQQFYSDNITETNLKEYTQIILDYCKLSKYSDCPLETPKLEFKPIAGKATCAYYNFLTNTICIGENSIQEILIGKLSVFELVDSIGHEMRHYEQNAYIRLFKQMSPEEQKQIPKEVMNLISKYLKSSKLTEKEIKLLRDKFYQNSNIPDSYDNEKSYLCALDLGAYASLITEKEARESGFELVNEIINKIQSSMELTDYQAKAFNLEKEKYFFSIEGEETLGNRYSDYFKQFNENNKLNFDGILGSVERIEKNYPEFRKIDGGEYYRVLRYLVDNEIPGYKAYLLQSAMKKGLYIFADILVDSMMADVYYETEKDRASEVVRSDLIRFCCNDLRDSDKRLVLNSCKKMLNMQDFQAVAERVIESDISNAHNFIKNGQMLTLDFLEKCQNIYDRSIEKQDGWEDFLKEGKTLFFAHAFRNADIESKIKYLENSERLQPEILDELIKAIKEDAKYCIYQGEVEAILDVNTIVKI